MRRTTSIVLHRGTAEQPPCRDRALHCSVLLADRRQSTARFSLA